MVEKYRRKRITESHYAKSDEYADPEMSDKELQVRRASVIAANAVRSALARRSLPDGRVVLDIGLVSFNEDIASSPTSFELPTAKGERHTSGDSS